MTTTTSELASHSDPRGTAGEIALRILSSGRLGPEKDELEAILATGLTYAEIAEIFAVREGTVKSWVSRAGLATRRPRYANTVPWTVKPIHRHEYPLKMLRCLGRRLDGAPLSPEDAGRLDSFLHVLWHHTPRLVIGYARWRMPGCVTVPGRWVGNGKIPIQRDEVPEPSLSDGGRHKRYMVVEEDPVTGTWAQLNV